jgi:Tfp pilus assembly protein PilV
MLGVVMLNVVLLSVIMLGVIMLVSRYYAECHDAGYD